jgi:hypothetical protein
MSENKSKKPPICSVGVRFDVDVKTRIYFDFDDLYYINDGQFSGDILDAERVLFGLKRKVEELEKVIAYAKTKRDEIANRNEVKQ